MFTPFAFVKQDSQAVLSYISASGGWIIVKDGYKYHKFINSGSSNFIVDSIGSGANNTLEYVIVAGGGGGGVGRGGGGGAGGLITGSASATVQTYSVSVGPGAALRNDENNPGRTGVNSMGFAVTASGGGGGGSWNSSSGTNGGSGGGESGRGTGTNGTGSAGQGFAGGSVASELPGGGGGGGASAVGGNGGSNGGNGGNGYTWYDGLTYAGGGGAGAGAGGAAGTGGTGGGGNGVGSNTAAFAGTDGLGGGGGGADGPSGPGGAGGSGTVVVRYPTLDTLGPLTTAFIAPSAADITSSTIINALNAFETGLYNYLIPTSSFAAIYPFVGATSGSMAWNFVNTNRGKLTYSGSLTFTSGGLQAAGSPKNGRAGSLPGATLLSTSSLCSYVYVTDYQARSEPAEAFVGSTEDANPGAGLTQFYLDWSTSGAGSQLVNPTNPATGQGNGAVTDPSVGYNSKGGYALSRTAVNSMKAYKNGSATGTHNTTTLTGKSYASFTTPVNILSRQNNTVTTIQSRLGWASIGSGLNDTQMANYHTLVAAFQTSMSRA